MLIKTVRGFTPSYGERCFIAENATLIGDLVMGDECSVWYQAVIRGDVNSIRIGNQVNIQDGVVIHATYKTASTLIGNKVSIGHNAIVHGCTIKNNVLVGMGSIIMDHCVVGSNSIIAAGAVVTQNTIIPPGSIYAGIPAKKIKDIDLNLQENEIERIAQNYLKYASWFK
ncbi:gamma carbonic anhydrase family protein [Flavobacteriaceae bacterium]|jgi:carbonic anhydrase/acetyltransferase-like protein (isoleucine patch superfamily)|nr:gamma carbonic anhydrase family protein [Flavobacteriaceae bacterium]MDA9124439.1 gamma carbonic anhydrase family protein [bacterium]MBT4313073.1 gamma carbonic anhydrase family protein [Flavobacteriaceae bacterium]MBT5090874.1 gamma carbonic anhydrase family protein [Flavobacteriaceae bacterium]MBT5282791.1 gamma carbonic anhydrase family protein [Flavobacteriaceae bacterium]|tara:strand:- start:9983 stop:10492 length:510 start_codon:yes stop_codon:yes gene_type:complete